MKINKNYNIGSIAAPLAVYSTARDFL